MNTLLNKPIKFINFLDFNHQVASATIWQKEDEQYTVIETETSLNLTTIKFRITPRENSFIQFEIKSYDKHKNRTTYSSFELPKEAYELFLNGLRIKRTA